MVVWDVECVCFVAPESFFVLHPKQFRGVNTRPGDKGDKLFACKCQTPTGEAFLSRVKLGLLARRNFILASIDMYLEHRAASGLLKVPILF